MIRTQTEARRFFIEKVLAEARHQGAALSDDERQMLSWSESEPDSKEDPELAARLAAEIDRALGRRLRPWWKFTVG